LGFIQDQKNKNKIKSWSSKKRYFMPRICLGGPNHENFRPQNFHGIQ
jgi:hypothetical protein